MSRKNINESIIKDVMGHTKIEITQKYYIQNNIETVKDTMEILDNFGDRNSLQLLKNYDKKEIIESQKILQ